MNFKTVEDIRKEGFQGFVRIAELYQDSSLLPHEKGVYLVLYREDQKPVFLERGSGGSHKGKNPNVPISTLVSAWVNDTIVLYIGQAGGKRGGKESNATLQSRIKTYLSFGRGRKAGHWGGRLIWQIQDSQNLIVCWKRTEKEDPKKVEENLIQEFQSIYQKRPFANLQD
jgi:hypothetical protein